MSFQLIITKNNDLIHQFNSENAKELDEWLNILHEINDLNKLANNSTNSNDTSNNSMKDDSPSKELKFLNEFNGQYNNIDLNKVKT